MFRNHSKVSSHCLITREGGREDPKARPMALAEGGPGLILSKTELCVGGGGMYIWHGSPGYPSLPQRTPPFSLLHTNVLGQHDLNWSKY